MRLVVGRSNHVFWETFWHNHSGGQGPFLGGYPPQARAFVIDNLRSRLPNNGRVIDIGAGADLWLSKQIKQALPGTKVTALDILPADQLGARGSGIEYIQASACATGLPPASFEAVVSTFTLDYLGGDRPRALAEISRLLKPGGFTILTLHHQNSYLAPGLRYEAGLLARCKQELSGLLASTRFRERFACLQTINIVTAGLRNMLMNIQADKMTASSDAELKLLVQEEISQLEANIALWSAMTRHVFGRTYQVRDFFRGCGFSPEVVTRIHYDSYLLGFGIVASPENK